MLITRRLTILFALGMTACGISEFARVEGAEKPGVVVSAWGIAEWARSQDVACTVEGERKIESILAEGTRVKKGQLVCTLDAWDFEEKVASQAIEIQYAEAKHLNASLTRQVAQIAVTEYLEGTYKQEVETIKGEIALADAELSRAVDRLDWSEKMKERGHISGAQYTADELSLRKAEFTAEQAQTKLHVLEEYTKAKTIKALQGEVEKAKAEERAKAQGIDLEKLRQEKARRQIETCKLYAPCDGTVVFANNPARLGLPPAIGVGEWVRERQVIFSVPDVNSPLRVRVKVGPETIDRIRPGMRARVRVGRLKVPEMAGEVEAVSPRPDPGTESFTVLILVQDAPPELQPGSPAEVEILEEAEK